MPRIFPLEILGTEQMNQADRMTIDAGTDSYDLMTKAGQAVAKEVSEYLSGQKVTVLCGPGNNGGDGFVAARDLRERGWQVRTACLTETGNLKGDASRAAAEWDGEILTFEQIEPQDNNEVIVDAVFGNGFRGDLPDAAAELFHKIKRSQTPVIAIDFPSGLNGDSGEICEDSLHASMTVTFFRKKLGHILMPGMACCGPVTVHDIGIQNYVLDQTGIAAYENHPVLWRNRIRPKTRYDNKYTFGHMVVLGGPEMTGAALLAAHAGIRVRTGMCTIAGPGETSSIYRSYNPSLIFENCENASMFAEHIRDRRRTAALIGPGAGKDDSEGLRHAILECCELGEEKGLVLDADALNAFQGRTDELFELLHKKCVLTPHEGEFARLFDDLDDDIKPVRAIEAAALSGAVVVLKGADTVIATPDGRCVIDANGPPSLATAGSGDVLAGMIAGLLAQGLPAFEAACAAAWIQGEAACSFGPGLISADLPDLIPDVLRELS